MRELEPQVIYGLEEQNYHTRPEYSKSRVASYMKDPLTYWAEYISDEPLVKVPSASMELGTLLHMRVLEPSRWNDEIYVASKDDPKKPTEAQLRAKKPSDDTKAQIKSYKEFVKLIKDKKIVSQEDGLKVEKAYNSIMNHPVAGEYIKAIEATEVTILYNLNGLRCRSRLDGWIGKDSKFGPTIIDLKTARHSDATKFNYAINDYMYDIQDYMYRYGAARAFGLSRMPQFKFIAIEMCEPFHIGVYSLSEERLRLAADKLKRGMEQLRYSEENDYWPDYNNNQEVIL